LFEGGVIAENLICGVAMNRRAQYMYATSISQDELGKLETGLGSCRGFDGSPTLVLPTETFDKEFINQKLWCNWNYCFSYTRGNCRSKLNLH
jgi:alkyl sulfatase BDS1-like metallo-beta-lactamase superfamily hydrolase